MLSRFLSIRCTPLYPNGGNVEIVITTRAAESQLVREHMLAQFVLAAHDATLDWRDSVTCYRRPRIQGQRLSVNMELLPHTPSLSKGERINVHPCEGST